LYLIIFTATTALKGKKNNISKNDFLIYFAKEQLKLNQAIIDEIINELSQKLPSWLQLIDNSFLSIKMKEKYKNLLHERSKKLFPGLILTDSQDVIPEASFPVVLHTMK